MMPSTNTVREVAGAADSVDLSAPLAGATAGRLEFRRGTSRVWLRGEVMDDLFRAHFEGLVPEVTVEGGTVGVRYHHLSPAEWARHALFAGRHSADVALNVAVPWEIELRGGVSRLVARIDGLRVTSVEVRGGASHVELELGRPEAVVPIRVVGGASHVTIWRPAGVPVRATVRGGASRLVLDEQRFGAIGGESRLTSGDWAAGAGYDVEITGGASHLAIGGR
jgi:hypothetical protein